MTDITILNKNITPLRATAWVPPKEDKTVPVEWLISQPLLPFLVKAMPAHTLYLTLKEQGFEDCVEVVEWIRGPQLHKVLDFDLWSFDPQRQVLDIASEKFFTWIRLWREIDQNFAAERTFELEEDLLVPLFAQLFTIVPAGIGQDPEEDDWKITPDRRFYLKAKQETEEELLFLYLDSLYAVDMMYTGSILAHAAMLVREEALELENRWRAGRLADAGFVLGEEAQELLTYFPLETLKNSAQSVRNYETKRQATLPSAAELDEDLFQEALELLFSLEPETGRHLLAASLQALEGSSSADAGEELHAMLTLEDDPEFTMDATKRLLFKAQDLLMRVQSAQSQTPHATLLLDQLLAQWAESSSLKARLARLANALVGATSFRGDLSQFDQDGLTRSLFLTRGFLNLGIEYVLENQEAFGVGPAHQGAGEREAPDKLALGQQILKEFGPEFLFRVGFSLCHEAIRLCTKILDELMFEQAFAASFKPSVPLATLAAQQKYAELQNWLSQAAPYIHPLHGIVLENLFQPIPMFSVALDQNPETLLQLSPRSKPFETLAELHGMERFIQGLEGSFQK